MYEAVKRCIGLVEYHYCKKVTPCSGSMILAPNKTIIATAAHCIFDWKSKQFYDEISFTPYILRERKRYKVQEAYILKRWADKAEVLFIHYLMAFKLKLEKGEQSYQAVRDRE